LIRLDLVDVDDVDWHHTLWWDENLLLIVDLVDVVVWFCILIVG
jgi:hypothetical protein